MDTLAGTYLFVPKTSLQKCNRQHCEQREWREKGEQRQREISLCRYERCTYTSNRLMLMYGKQPFSSARSSTQVMSMQSLPTAARPDPLRGLEGFLRHHLFRFEIRQTCWCPVQRMSKNARVARENKGMSFVKAGDDHNIIETEQGNEAGEALRVNL